MGLNSNEFYVYAYLREDGTPYYVGKGKGSRAYGRHRVSRPLDKTKIVFWHTNLFEDAAYYLEKSYIKLFGRKDLKTGILRNMTDGGEGTSGRKMSEEHRKIISRTKSIEHRRSLSESHKGKTLLDDHRKKISKASRGRKHSEETKRKMSETRKGRKCSEEHRKALSEAWKRRRNSLWA